MGEDREGTPKKLKVEPIAMSPSQKLMTNRITEFNDAGMVIVQNHTFAKPDRVLWAMSTSQACEFYTKMPPSFIKKHPLLLKYNNLGDTPYNTAKYLTKSIGLSMGVYPGVKTRRLLELFFFRTNTWKRIIAEPSTEGYHTLEELKTIFYKMVFVLMREDKTCGLASEYIRTAFLVAQHEAKDLCPAKTTFLEVLDEVHLPVEVLHKCTAADCTCPHDTDLIVPCNCNVLHITKIEVLVAKFPLHDISKPDNAPWMRDHAMLLGSLNDLFDAIMLSHGFRKIREHMAIAMEQYWSAWKALTGYAAVTTPGDTAPAHQKDWPLLHNCARIMNMPSEAFRSCVQVEKFRSFNVNLGIGKHKMPRYLCYITRDSILYVAYMAHSQWDAGVGALRVLMYHIHFRIPWSLHHDPALACVAEKFSNHDNLPDFRKDYPYDDVN